MLKPCIVCGEPAEGSRCAEHPKPSGPNLVAPRVAGYDAAWDRLSKRARRMQPWCSDCGTVEDLTCDHSAEAWARKQEGKPITLAFVDVVCRSCNSKRGKARPATWGETPTGKRRSAAGEAKSPSHTPGGIR